MKKRIQKIIRVILQPKKVIAYFYVFLKYTLRKKKGILFFIGMDPTGAFGLIHRGYKKCYCFEPNPDRFEKISKKYKKYKNINLYNVAVTDHNGEIPLNIASNDGASSSVGTFNKKWDKYKNKSVMMVDSITVKCIDILDFCSKNDIHFIDEYISDIQGMDLTVLNTLKPMIDSKSIGSITCEVAKDNKKNIYADLPDNSENGFHKLLGENYVLVAKGHGLLAFNTIQSTNDEKWEMDCKWQIKC